MNLDPIAKVLIISGVILLIGGVLWQFGLLQSLKLGRLPGDIVIEKENMKIYFPVTTGILISLVFSLISWFFRQ